MPLTPSQELVLRALAEAPGPLSHAALCAAVERNPDTVKVARIGLQALKLVSSEGKGRDFTYTLTEEGRWVASGVMPPVTTQGPPQIITPRTTPEETTQPARENIAKSQKLNEKKRGSSGGAPTRTTPERSRTTPPRTTPEDAWSEAARVARLLAEAYERIALLEAERVSHGKNPVGSEASWPSEPESGRSSDEPSARAVAPSRSSTGSTSGTSAASPTATGSASSAGAPAERPEASTPSAPHTSSETSSTTTSECSRTASTTSSGSSGAPTPAEIDNPPPSPEEVELAAEEETDEDDKGKRAAGKEPIGNRRAWQRDKLKELRRDGNRVREALARRSARIERERLEKERVEKALLEKAAKNEAGTKRAESEAAERDRVRELDASVKALDPEARADLEARASEDLQEKGLRPGKGTWAAALGNRMRELVESSAARRAGATS